MNVSKQRWTVVALCALAAILPAQELSDPVVLIVEIGDTTTYRGDTSDLTKLATLPGPTMGVLRTFQPGLNMGDIVAVNGKPAKGLWNNNTVQGGQFRVSPTTGLHIANVDVGPMSQCFWNIFLPDGTFVGSITDRAQEPATGGAGHVVLGGNGAFLGVIGEHRLEETITPARAASTSEDPSMRWIHGGGKMLIRFTLYPKFRPNIQMTATGPAIFHDDFSQVTSARPARAGEVLIVRVTGLGPTKPALDPPGARRFSANPPEEVNSPVEVTINGNQGAVLNKIGWPGETNLYRVDFRVPDGTPAGTAAVRLTAAWIPGSDVTIPVR
jgi:hypothetical protein